MHYIAYLFSNKQNITFLQNFWHFYSIYQNKYLVLQCNINLSNPNYSQLALQNAINCKNNIDIYSFLHIINAYDYGNENSL